MFPTLKKKYSFGIGLIKNIPEEYEEYKTLYEELKQFGKLNYEDEPEHVDMYFLDFGIGYEGALNYKNSNFQKGIKYLENNKSTSTSTLVFGRFPIPDYLTKLDELKIATEYYNKNKDKPNIQYSPRGIWQIGQKLIGNKFIFRSLDAKAGGRNMEFTTNNTLNKPGLLIKYFDNPLLYEGIYNKQKIKSRVELRIYGSVKYDELQIWRYKDCVLRIGSPKYGNYQFPPVHESQIILNSAMIIKDGLKDFFTNINSEFRTCGTTQDFQELLKKNNLDYNKVMKNIDNALINYYKAHLFLIKMDKSILKNWCHSFNADIGINNKGEIRIYEVHSSPTLKLFSSYEKDIEKLINNATYSSILVLLEPESALQLGQIKIN